MSNRILAAHDSGVSVRESKASKCNTGQYLSYMVGDARSILVQQLKHETMKFYSHFSLLSIL